MSSMDPMDGAPAYDARYNDQAPDGAAGVCSACGRSLPPADLEAVAAEIDHTLSLESGKMVARTAWAGRAPDGMMDALFSFTSGAKSRRQLWERGQHLWAEHMTAAMSGPCADCQQDAGDYAPATDYPPANDYPQAANYPPAADYAPAATIMQPGAGAQYHDAPQGSGGASPYDSGTAILQPEDAVPTAYHGGPGFGTAPTEGETTAFPPYQDYDADSAAPGDDAATRATPAFLEDIPPASDPTRMPPTPAGAAAVPASTPAPSDDYESHTVMFTGPLNIRPAVAPAKLAVLEGPVHGRQFTMNRAATTIGRSIGCHVTVEDDAVAYDHARVVRGDDGWSVEAVAGGGDVFVNDDVVSGPRALRSGDVIRVGPARLRFETAS